MASYVPIPVHPRSILLLAAAMVAIVAAVLLANGAMGAGSPTRLHSFSFSSASGTMSSGSYGVIADLGPVGFVGRADSSNYTIQMGTGSTHIGGTPTPTPVSIPTTSGWGLAALAATLLVMTAILLRRPSGHRPATRP